MTNFLDDFEKVFPEEEQKKEEASQQSISLQDMKLYFDALKEQMSTQMKQEMDEYIKNIKGGNDNASETNLQRGEQDSTEH